MGLAVVVAGLSLRRRRRRRLQLLVCVHHHHHHHHHHLLLLLLLLRRSKPVVLMLTDLSVWRERRRRRRPEVARRFLPSCWQRTGEKRAENKKETVPDWLACQASDPNGNRTSVGKPEVPCRCALHSADTFLHSTLLHPRALVPLLSAVDHPWLRRSYGGPVEASRTPRTRAGTPPFTSRRCGAP